MNSPEELADLVLRGDTLTERYPDAMALANARARFTRAPDIRHLGASARIDRAPRMGLPQGPRKGAPPAVAIVTPDIVGPIRNGGIGTAYTALARALALAGHDVTILYTLGNYCEDGSIEDWIESYRTQRIHFVPLPSPPEPAVVYGPRDSLAVYRWLSTRTFDVVHFPEWRGIGFCSVQAKKLGLALTKTLLCTGVHSPTLWHDLENRVTIDRIEQLELDFLERQSVQHADVVVSPSQFLLSWLDRWDWTTPDRTYVWPYVIDPPSCRNPPGALVPIRTLAFFGRLESRKGLEVFCDAIDRLSADTRMAGASVTFLGKVGRANGRDALEYLRERARRWTHAWSTLVDLSRDQAIEYLATHQALAVMPSLADNTPNTVLECLAAGLPFVASNVGGIPETVAVEDHDRCLVRPEAEALARSLALRLEAGGIVARPAADPAVVRRGWVEWHEAQTPSPQSRAAIASASLPRVSVCMATHDRPTFLGQALDSIRRQTYANLEVVLIDDGSQSPVVDAQLRILEPEFLERGWTLRRTPRRFPGTARNTAAALAHGRYILFMDDDNVALPDEVATLVRCAEHSGAEILTCAHDAFEGDTPPGDVGFALHRWIPLGGAIPLGLFVNRIGDTNMLVRRDAFFAAGGFDEEAGAGLVEDWAFFSKALVRGLRVEMVPEPLYWYRVGSHGFGQRSPSYESYQRPVQPVIDVLPAGLGLALLYASGSFRRSPDGPPMAAQPEAAMARVSPARPSRFRDWLHRRLVATLNRPVAGIEEGEHLSGRFLAGAPMVTFAPGELVEVEPIRQVEIVTRDKHITMRSLGDEPQLALRISTGAFGRGPLLVRLDVTTPKATVAQLFWKTPVLPVYREEQSVRTHLEPGRNIRHLRIPSQTILGRLRFDPSACSGELRLHSLEIRREVIAKA